MTRPFISIITPTRNRRTALLRAIASVRAQTVSDYEHIIVDDGSHDGTEELVRGIGDERIRYTRFDQWQGANAARNRGVELARAELLTFLDSDDEFLPTRLETTLQRCKAQPQIQLFISSFQTMKGDRACPSVNPNLYLDGGELELALMTYAINIAGSSITVRRDHLLRAGGFDPRILRLQDRELLLRLSRLGGAQLSSEIDWIKHRSPDSISLPRRGYVQALGAMMAGYPEQAHRYRGLLCYHVARHMLSDLTHGRVVSLWESYRANRAATDLQFTIWQLLGGYRTGSKARRQFAAEIRDREHESQEFDPQTILPFPTDPTSVPASVRFRLEQRRGTRSAA